MKLLELSKFKLHLRSLATEFRDLRERERSASEQCRLLTQKQRQTEEEYGRKILELQAELASSKELRINLERKVSFLENDNALLDNKQKELKGTIQSLLQSRDSFVNAYEESTCEMKCAIEARDRKISILSEKINSHLSLFDSIEKEAFSIKQLVDSAQSLVSEKEEVVIGLRSKMHKVSTFESLFVERIHDLEKKLKNGEDELQRKDKIISEIKAELEAEKISENCQSQIEELQKTILAKDAVVQNLISDKEALHCEVASLATILQKIQETVATVNEQDKRLFSSVLECYKDCNMVMASEEYRTADAVHDRGATSPNVGPIINVSAARNQVSSSCQDWNSVLNALQETNNFTSSMSEYAGLSPKSILSENQAVGNGPTNSAKKGQVNCTTPVQHMDSESSTTQAETSELPGTENDANGVSNSLRP